MKTPKELPLVSCLLVLTIVLSACSFSVAQPAPTPAPTDTPAPTATNTSTPSNTPRPSPTPRPTKTPNLAATQKAEEFEAEAQKYFDEGYLASTNGRFREFEDFDAEWAQLGWYNWYPLGVSVDDFYISAHFSWDSAYQNADESGCGFVFAIQEDYEHYSAFLDRSKILVLDADNSYAYSRLVGTTRGTGRVKFSMPAEADFTLIVNDAYVYVLVDAEVIGEYTLSQSRNIRGDIGLSILSGTNKDYGTHCTMTDIHMFIPG